MDSDWPAPAPDASAALADAFPPLSGPVSEIIRRTAAHGIRTLLLVDFSWGSIASASEGERSRVVDYLVGLVKDLHEESRDATTAIREIYFLDHWAYDQVAQAYARQATAIRYPAYSRADIFGILMRHYPTPVKAFMSRGQPESVAGVDLSAVLHSSILDDVERDFVLEGRRLEDLGLVETIDLVEAKIREYMNVPWSEVTFHVSGPMS